MLKMITEAVKRVFLLNRANIYLWLIFVSTAISYQVSAKSFVNNDASLVEKTISNTSLFVNTIEVPVDSCRDSLVITFPTQSLCPGDEFDLKVSFQSGADIYWYNNSTGGVPIDTTQSGESKKLSLDKSTQFYLEAVGDSASCNSGRIPVAIYVNNQPEKPNITNTFEICKDSLIDITTLIIDAPDELENYFTVYKNPERINEADSLVSEGNYFVFQESESGCISEPAVINIKEIDCDSLVDGYALNFEKTSTLNTIKIGQQFKYTLQLENSGREEVTSIEIEDVLPESLVLVSADKEFKVDEDTLKLSIDTLKSGERLSYAYVVLAEEAGEVVNVAKIISADSLSIEALTALKSSKTVTITDSTYLEESDNIPVIIKTSDMPKVSQGETVTYTIEVSNIGESSIKDIVVTDSLPTGLSLLETGGDFDLIEESKNKATFTIDKLAIGQKKKLKILAVADSLGMITNKAEIISFLPEVTGDPDTMSLSSSVKIEVIELECDLPTPVISAKRTHINFGDTLTLTAVGCSNVIWSNGEKGKTIEVSPGKTTVYTAQCYLNNCKGAASNEIEISVVNAVKPVIKASETEICYGQEVTLTVAGCNEGIRWSNGEVGEIIKVVPLINSEFFVTCEDSTLIEYKSNVIEILVDTNKTGFVKTVDFISNTCPIAFVDLNDVVTDYSKGSTIVFKQGVYPSSPDSDHKITEKGLYYAFAKDKNGCFSESSPITVNVSECEDEVIESDLSLQFLYEEQKAYMVGDTLNLTTIIANLGEDNLYNIEVVNVVPKDLELLSTSKHITIKNAEVVWEIDTLVPQAKDSINFEILLSKKGVYKFIANTLDTNDIKIAQVTTTINVSDALPCIAVSLDSDTTALADGTFLLDLTTYLSNCGHFELTSVEAELDLSTLVDGEMNISQIGGVSLNNGSILNINDDYDGIDDTQLLFVGSVLPIGASDTIKVKYRVAPNGSEEKYLLNTIVSGEFAAGEKVSDVSNYGKTAEAGNSSPTVVRFVESPPLNTILYVEDIIEVDETAEVSFVALIKNNTKTVIDSVVVSNSLFTYLDGVDYFEVQTLETTGGLIAEKDFTGKGQFIQLTTSQSQIAPGEVDTIKYTVLLKGVYKNLYYNQLLVSGKLNKDRLDIVSHWSEDINDEGSSMTEIHLDNIDIKIEYCLRLGLVATDRLMNDDGSVDISYTALLTNCGAKDLSSVNICDDITAGLSDSTTVTLLSKPKLSSSSLLFLNNDFDGINNTCMLNPSFSSLSSGKSDTITYSIRVKPVNEKVISKQIKAEGYGADSTFVEVLSNDGFSPYYTKEPNPTIVSLDSSFNNLEIGLAKNLEWVTKTDSLHNIFEMEFSFLVKNYSDQLISNIQISDDLYAVFGDSVLIHDVYFTKTPLDWEVNTDFGLAKDNINLLKGSSATIGPYQSATINFVVQIELESTKVVVFENSGLVIGNTISGEMLEDLSTDGLNPDSNGSGSALDDDVPTVIDLSSLITKEEGEIVPLGIALEGSYELTSSGSTRILYTVYIKNYGISDLSEVMLKNDLTKVFEKNTQYVLLKEPTVNSGSGLMPNDDYDGVNDIELLQNGSVLGVGQQDTLTFEVGVFNVDDSTQTYKNQVIGSALYEGNEVTDWSVAGSDPDADGDGDPGNDSGYTIIEIEPGNIDLGKITVVIPEGISPNGDGVNDEFILGLENGVPNSILGKISLKIYNRWGHPVYESKNYIRDLETGKGWKGNANVGVVVGKDNVLPVGTYFYKISSSEKAIFGGQEKVGYITLMR